MNASKRATAMDRNSWLAELAEAIEQAAQLVWRLGYAEGDSADARTLFTRLGGLRAELDMLRHGGWTAVPQLNPVWINLFPPR